MKDPGYLTVDVTFSGDAVIAAYPSAVTAFDAVTGSTRWTAMTPFKPIWMTATDDTVYVTGGYTGAVAAYDSATGTQRWTVALPAEYFAGSVASETGGKVAVLSAFNEFVILDPATGQLISRVPHFTGGSAGVAFDVSNGELFIGSAGESGGQVGLYDLATGAARWMLDVPSNTLSNPVFTESAVVFSADGGDVYSVDRVSGTVLWQAGLSVPGERVALGGDGIIAAAAAGGDIEVFDIASGAQVVRVSANASGSNYGQLGVGGGVVTVKAYDASVEFYDATTGDYIDASEPYASVHMIVARGSLIIVSGEAAEPTLDVFSIG